MSLWVKSRLASWRLSTTAILAVVAFVALSAACGGEDPTPSVRATTAPTAVATSTSVPAASPTVQTVEQLAVVASTSILADWVREVGGDRVTVTSLVPRQSDPHNFQPGARDIAAVADADVVFVVGLGLEETWLDDLIRNAAKSPDTIVELAEGINPIPFSEFGGGHDDHGDEHGHDEHDEDHEGEGHDEDEEEHHEDEDADAEDHDEDHEGEGHDEDGDEHHEDEDGHGDDHAGHDHGPNDPHFWFDPARVKVAVDAIERELSSRAPSLHDQFHEGADAYMAKLDELDTWVTDRVASVPQANRFLVTTHDSFGYFAERYGFEIIGAVIPGGGTEVEPSPTELTALAALVQEHGVSVIFSEVQLSDALTQTLASEAGATVVSGLYTGSLGADGSPAATYVDMMRNNAEVIANALSGS